MDGLREIELSPLAIKKLTPYLDSIKDIVNGGKNGDIVRNLGLKERAFAWYYCYNGGNKSDAYRRAYCSVKVSSKGKLIVDREISQDSLYCGGDRLYRKARVHEAILKIRADMESKVREDVQQSIIDQLVVQATYDPQMFVNPDGSPAFSSWDQIPPKYRCCVEGIETRKHGKEADVTTIFIKLVNRDRAREQLQKLVPGLFASDRMEILFKTLNKEGKEVGIDYEHLSDKALRAIIKASRCPES